MKKIGKQVLFIGTEENNPRNGEGAFIRLNDGGIMYAYTEYIGNSWFDHANARITAVYSYDEGETWSEKHVLHEKKPSDMNLMSVSLMRMANGDIGLFFLKKTMEEGLVNCKLHIIRSADEGKTWSDEICCVGRNGYFVTNNDRVIRLSDGRLMFPGNLHEPKNDSHEGIQSVCKECFFFVSDDDGYTWSVAGESEKCNFLESGTNTGLHENGIYQLEDGRIMAWSRTDLGTQVFSYSDNGGKTWSAPMQNVFFTSAVSPLQIKDIGKYTIAVFNPTPEYLGRDRDMTWGRTPYVVAVSTDKAKTFGKVFYLEDDPKNGYCYPALIEVEGGFLVAYYHSNGTGVCLNSAKITKVMFSEIE